MVNLSIPVDRIDYIRRDSNSLFVAIRGRMDELTIRYNSEKEASDSLEQAEKQMLQLSSVLSVRVKV